MLGPADLSGGNTPNVFKVLWKKTGLWLHLSKTLTTLYLSFYSIVDTLMGRTTSQGDGVGTK